VGNDKPSKSLAIRLPGNKPAAKRIGAGMLVNTVSFIFTVRNIPPLFLLVSLFWFSQNRFSPRLADEVDLSSQGIFQSHGARQVPMRVGITAPGQAKKATEQQPQTAPLRRNCWDQSPV
jgi:hypothetical protein